MSDKLQTMKHHEWFAKVTSDSVRSVARTVGLPPRTLATQLEKGRVSPENVIAIAMAYDIHPVRALVDTGYLEPQYAQAVDPMTALQSVSEEQLAEEVLRRMTAGVKTKILIQDVNEVAEHLARKAAAEEVDHEAIIRQINEGTLQVAAQEATEPLEQHFT